MCGEGSVTKHPTTSVANDGRRILIIVFISYAIIIARIKTRKGENIFVFVEFMSGYLTCNILIKK